MILLIIFKTAVRELCISQALIDRCHKYNGDYIILSTIYTKKRKTFKQLVDQFTSRLFNSYK